MICEYQSLVDLPAGYAMLENQLLPLDDPDFPDDVALLRGSAQRPDGTTAYFSCPLRSVGELDRIAFWQDLWDMMRAYDPSTSSG